MNQEEFNKIVEKKNDKLARKYKKELLKVMECIPKEVRTMKDRAVALLAFEIMDNQNKMIKDKEE